MNSIDEMLNAVALTLENTDTLITCGLVVYRCKLQ